MPPLNPFMPATKSFNVTPADLPSDWEELFKTYWESWSSPLQAVAELTLPHIGTETSAEQASFIRLKQSYLNDALAHPTRIHWLKCVELRTGRIIGGACYETYFSNPYRSGRGKVLSAVAGRFEGEGELKALSELMYDQFLDWRVRLMSDAHILGTALWTLPQFRSQGAADLMFKYMVDIWNDLDLEAYMEGTVFSTSIALRSGFVRIAEHEVASIMRSYGQKYICTQNANRIVELLGQHSVSILWRPKKGKQYVDGVTVLPWEGEARKCKL